MTVLRPPVTGPARRPDGPRIAGGRRLGVDVGTVRIGVAASDPDGDPGHAGGDGARDRRTHGPASAPAGRAGRRATRPSRSSSGCPRTLADRAGPSAQDAIELADRLAERIAPVPVRLADERLTTVTAQRSLREAGVRSQRPARRDRPGGGGRRYCRAGSISGGRCCRSTARPPRRMPRRQSMAEDTHDGSTGTPANAPARWRWVRRGAGWTAPRAPAPSAIAGGVAPSACCRSACWAPSSWLRCCSAPSCGAACSDPRPTSPVRAITMC